MSKQASIEVLFDASLVLVSRTDTRGIITFANEAFCSTAGYSRNELIGQPHNMVRHSDMPLQAFKDLWDTLKQGRCWTGLVKNRTKQGGYYWVKANVSPEYGDDGRVSGYISVRTKPARAEIAAAEQLYGAVRTKKKAFPKTLRFSFFQRLNLFHMLVLIGLLTLVPFVVDMLEMLGYLAHIDYIDTAMLLVEILPMALLIPIGLTSKQSLERLKQGVQSAMRGKYDNDLRMQRDDEYADLFTAVHALQYRMAFEEQSVKDMGKDAREMERRQQGMAARYKFETANEIDTKVEASLENVTRKMDVLGEISESLSAISEELSRQAEMAASGVKQSMEHASVTAAAAEEMSATIGDLATRAQDAQRVTEGAVADAQTVNETVHRLGVASEEIGSVLTDIRDIAKQTNLLALNASIEAQHAGDAGKGFAVVAEEVKNLAEQTAKATEDIEQRIAQIQKESHSATAALEGIAATIVKVNDYVKSVAVSMDEQTTATSEIAEAAQKTDAEMRQVQEGVRDVESASVETAEMSMKMLSSSNEAKSHMLTLEHELQASLKGLRKDGVVAMLQSHQEWEARIQDAANTHASPFKPDDVAKVEYCALGKWLAEELKGKDGKTYQDADRLHRQYHQCAGSVLAEALQGNAAVVSRALGRDGDYQAAYRAMETGLIACGIDVNS